MIHATCPNEWNLVRVGIPRKGEYYCYCYNSTAGIWRTNMALCDLNRVFPVIEPLVRSVTIGSLGLFVNIYGGVHWGTLVGYYDKAPSPYKADNDRHYNEFFPVPGGRFVRSLTEVEEGLVPQGYEAVEYRVPQPRELWLDSYLISDKVSTDPQLVVRKVSPTKEDIGKRAMFSDEGRLWIEGTLGDVVQVMGKTVYITENWTLFTRCEICQP